MAPLLWVGEPNGEAIEPAKGAQPYEEDTKHYPNNHPGTDIGVLDWIIGELAGK